MIQDYNQKNNPKNCQCPPDASQNNKVSTNIGQYLENMGNKKFEIFNLGSQSSSPGETKAGGFGDQHKK
jgi:hypothetical protein